MPRIAFRRDTLPASERLHIPPTIGAQVLAHAVECVPHEACGLFAVDEDGTITTFYPVTNVERSPVRFTLDPSAHYDAIVRAELNGWSIGGVMHSHLRASATPSQTDIAQPHEPEWFHVIVGLRPRPHLRAWRIVESTPIELTLV